jgi:methionine-rich copper-binding protein CopC
MKRFTGVALVAGLLFIVPQTLIPQALFANTLVSTTPVAGAALQSAPSAVTVTTELPLLDVGNEITVTDPTGARVDDGALTIDLDSAVIGLKPLVKSGIYTVNYSLLAENDVPLMGKFTFNFIEPSVAEPVAPEPVKPTPTPSGNNLGTTVFVLGLLLAALVVTFALARYARKIYSER